MRTNGTWSRFSFAANVHPDPFFSHLAFSLQMKSAAAPRSIQGMNSQDVVKGGVGSAQAGWLDPPSWREGVAAMRSIAFTAFAVGITMSLAMSASQAQPVDMSNVDRAEVLDVQPYRDRSVADGPPQVRLREECWNERIRGYEGGYYRDGEGRLYRDEGRTNANGMLIGALVGGAMGNQVGKGDGRTAATVARAVIGGAIGAHTDNDENEFRGDDGVVRRCRTVVTKVTYGPSDHDFIVTYRYAGRIYTARTEHNPGRWIPVVVQVRPQDAAIDRR